MMPELQFTEVFPIKKIRGCYLLWKDGKVVYVGQSENIMHRVGIHLAKKQKDFDGFSYVVLETENLDEVEAALIAKYKPGLTMRMPPNSRFEGFFSIQRRLHYRRTPREIKKILEAKNVTPVWRDYYLVSDIEGIL